MEVLNGGLSSVQEACLGGVLVGFFVGGGVIEAIAGCAIGVIGESIS